MSTVEAASEVATIPLSSIRVQESFNPRRAFRALPMERLIDSIRAEGLIQPILVRPDDAGEGYILIAGERRLRACIVIGLPDVPALIRHVDADQARVLAILENIDRADLSAAEEALAAREALDIAGGDRAATASQLGWSATKLEARLLLLTASPAVLAAVAEGTIHVGHAELLAGLPFAQQDKALSRIIENKVSIPDLREQVKGILIPLSSAIFDTAGCSGCPASTVTQRGLFGDSVEGSFCKNRACFTTKTQSALELKRSALAEDVGTVALTTEKDESSYISLIVNGEGGVGTEQFAQCRGCTHFGALIHAQLDNKCGQVDRPVCFHRPCHTEKVAARADALKEEAASRLASNGPASTTEVPASATPSKAKKAVGKAATKTAKTAAPAASPSNARTLMKPAYAAAAAALMVNDTRVPLALAILAMSKVLTEAGVTVPDDTVPQGKKPEDVLAVLAGLEPDEVVKRFKACVEAMIGGKQTNSNFSRNDVFPAVLSAALAQAAKADLAPHFTVTTEFLQAHTREGILALLAESGFKDWMEAQEGGAKKWKMIVAAKKADLAKSIMDAGFNWSGFIPQSVAGVTPRSLVGV